MDLQSCRLSANAFKELVTLVEEEKISALRGKDILSRLLEGSQDAPLTIAETEGWIQDRDQDALQIACKEVIKQYPDVVKKIQNGKPKLVKFFVGEVMKATKGKADPKFALTMLTELLKLDK